jgi:hypothetical protein
MMQLRIHDSIEKGTIRLPSPACGGGEGERVVDSREGAEKGTMHIAILGRRDVIPDS